jgi:hypothetical protein
MALVTSVQVLARVHAASVVRRALVDVDAYPLGVQREQATGGGADAEESLPPVVLAFGVLVQFTVTDADLKIKLKK